MFYRQVNMTAVMTTEAEIIHAKATGHSKPQNKTTSEILLSHTQKHDNLHFAT
jgi:hypothetical protein